MRLELKRNDHNLKIGYLIQILQNIIFIATDDDSINKEYIRN